MRIGVLAHKVGVSTRALRYYEEQGLIRSLRSAGGQRIYPDSAVERVELIRLLFAAGVPSRTVVSILPCLDTGGIDRMQLEMLIREQSRISDEIDALNRALERLSEVISTAVVSDEMVLNSVH